MCYESLDESDPGLINFQVKPNRLYLPPQRESYWIRRCTRYLSKNTFPEANMDNCGHGWLLEVFGRSHGEFVGCLLGRRSQFSLFALLGKSHRTWSNVRMSNRTCSNLGWLGSLDHLSRCPLNPRQCNWGCTDVLPVVTRCHHWAEEDGSGARRRVFSRPQYLSCSFVRNQSQVPLDCCWWWWFNTRI